jgi:hypothetical protein
MTAPSGPHCRRRRDAPERSTKNLHVTIFWVRPGRRRPCQTHAYAGHGHRRQIASAARRASFENFGPELSRTDFGGTPPVQSLEPGHNAAGVASWTGATTFEARRAEPWRVKLDVAGTGAYVLVAEL